MLNQLLIFTLYTTIIAAYVIEANNILKGFPLSYYPSFQELKEPELANQQNVFQDLTQVTSPDRFYFGKQNNKNENGQFATFNEKNKVPSESDRDRNIEMKEKEAHRSLMGYKFPYPFLNGFYLNNNHKTVLNTSNYLGKENSTLYSQQVKNKIISLANQTILDLQTQLILVENIHRNFRYNKFYRLGYVVSCINKTNEDIKDLTKNIVKNKEKWDVLRLLSVYEQIKRAKDFLSHSLSLVQQFNIPQTYIPNRPYIPQHKSRGGSPPDPISWSYYDDNI